MFRRSGIKAENIVDDLTQAPGVAAKAERPDVQVFASLGDQLADGEGIGTVHAFFVGFGSRFPTVDDDGVVDVARLERGIRLVAGSQREGGAPSFVLYADDVVLRLPPGVNRTGLRFVDDVLPVT